MHKKLLHVILVLGAVLLIGCGGGGGGSSSAASLVYDGKTEKAVLTEENTKYFLDLLGNFSQAIDTPSYFKSQKIAVSNKSNYKIGKQVAKNYKVIGEETVDGQISGSYTVVAEETGTYTGKLTYTYTNYSDYEGFTYNGTIVNSLTVNELEIITKSVMEYQLFNVKTNSDDVTIDGSMVASEVQSGTEIVENFVAKNNKTTEMLKYENYETLLNDQGQVVSFNGKVYNSNYGYVDVSTLVPLAYNSDGSRKAEGELLIDAEGSSTTIKYAYDNRIRVEIDNDKNGSVDTVQVYREGDYTKELPNEAPVISITFPDSIYTDTDMSTVQVNIYDPDLDEFTTVYEWTVNGTVKGSQVALDNALFKKHDMLKLTVSTTDDRIGDIKSKTQYREQGVLNSRPIITSTFEKLEITLGDTSKLDYNVTDADNDEINITWNHYYIDVLLASEVINEYYHPFFNDCDLAIEEYDRNHPNALYETLSSDEKEDLNRTYCSVDIPGKLVNYNFIQNDRFEAIAPGLFFHEMIVTDGEYNSTKVFDSNISKMDLVETSEYNHEQYSYATGVGLYMKDFDNDGNKDLIYIGSITKYSEGDTFEEPDGEIFTTDPYEYESPILVVEYRKGKRIISKEIYDVSRVGYSKFYVNDMNGDGRLDILFPTSNGYSPPTNETFKIMYQNQDGKLGKIETFVLENYIQDSLHIGDINSDGIDDIMFLGADHFSSTGIKIYTKDINLSIPTTSSPVSKVFLHDLNHDTKQDIVLVQKSISSDNSLSFECRILMQKNDGSFSEKEYSKVLDTNIKEFEVITDVEITDIIGMEDVFVVSTTNNIYLLKLEENNVSIVKKLPYVVSKRKLSTSIVPPVDINHDGKKDIVVFDTSLYAPQLISIFIQKDNYDFFIEQNYSFGYGYSSLRDPGYVLGDIDNDGQYEVFFNPGDDELSAIYFK